MGKADSMLCRSRIFVFSKENVWFSWMQWFSNAVRSLSVVSWGSSWGIPVCRSRSSVLSVDLWPDILVRSLFVVIPMYCWLQSVQGML